MLRHIVQLAFAVEVPIARLAKRLEDVLEVVAGPLGREAVPDDEDSL